jgi:putative ATP-binding cassette transporter
VTQFQSISAYTAVIARLAGLRAAMDDDAGPQGPTLEIRDTCDSLICTDLTLRSPRSGRDLVKDLTVEIPRGQHLLIIAPNESAKTALFRAIAGLWHAGEGLIQRPNDKALMFLPERPYLPPGTWRQLVTPSSLNGTNGVNGAYSDERILATVRALKLEPALTRAGGLDVERNWNELLSLGEQQLLAFARVILAEPCFVVLDHPTRALSECQIDELLKMLRDRNMTYITLGEDDDDPSAYKDIILFADDGTWSRREPATLRPPTTHG